MSNKEATEFVFDKLDQYFEAARHVIEQYGGDAVNLGLAALRIEAASELIPAVVTFIAALFLWKKVNPFAQFHIAKTISEEGGRRYRDDHDMKFIGAGAISAILILIFGIIFLSSVLNIWAWAGLFYPELYAVHQFILK